MHTFLSQLRQRTSTGEWRIRLTRRCHKQPSTAHRDDTDSSAARNDDEAPLTRNVRRTALIPAAAVAQPADAPADDGAAAASAGADACAADAAARGDDAADDGSAAAPAPEGLVRFVDVGCGFGGLLIRLAPLYADKLILGFELRDKVGAT